MAHTYNALTVSDQARAHFGDSHNHFYAASEDEKIYDNIIRTLRFEGMDRRSRDLSRKGRATFEWILGNNAASEQLDEDDTEMNKTGSSRTEARTTLKGWLSSSSQASIFWITGKPGSGKSMLAKAIQEHEDLDGLLKEWTHGDDYIISGHFFWLVGDIIQRSLDGMLRALLSDILAALTVRADLELLRYICGTRWTHRQRSRQWAYRDLEQSFARACRCDRLRIFFVIDGIDECESEDQTTLMEGISEWSKSKNVKFLLTSRPWPVFCQQFKSFSQFKVEDITLLDMYNHTKAQLSEAEVVQQVNYDFRDGTPVAWQLVIEVVRRAEGVFLWLALVIKTLAAEIRKGRPAGQLFNMVRQYPDGLENYFRDRIYARVEQTKQSRIDTANALMILLLARDYGTYRTYQGPSHLENSNLVMFSLLCRDQLFKPMATRELTSSVPCESLLWKNCALAFLQETCGDLVEISQTNYDMRSRDTQSSLLNTHVGFVHRSAFDFLHEAEMMSFIKANRSEHFNEGSIAERVIAVSTSEMMRQHDMSCEWSTSMLLTIARLYTGRRSGWYLHCLRECESFLCQHVAESCLHGLPGHHESQHWNCRISHAIFDTDLRKYPLAIMNKFPHLSFRDAEQPALSNDLAIWLDLHGSCLSKSHLSLACVNQLLEAGSNPNARCGKNGSHASVSLWELYLRRWIIHEKSQMKSGVNDVVARPQEDNVARIALAMLECGADPNCAPCISANDCSSHICRRLPLRDVIDTYGAPTWRPELLTKLKQSHDSQSFGYKFRIKRQQLRAFRSLLAAAPVSLLPSDVYLAQRNYMMVTFLHVWMSHISILSLGCDTCDLVFTANDLILICLDCTILPAICTSCTEDRSNPHKKHLLLRLEGLLRFDGEPFNIDYDALLGAGFQKLYDTLDTWYKRNAEAHGVMSSPVR